MTDQPREIEALLRGVAENAVRKLELRAWQILTSGTPVDKGTARSGWTPSAGSAVTSKITAPADEAQARSEASSRYGRNHAKALALYASYNLAAGKVFLTNPVPWIVPLNAGSSAQAPAMFVERGIETALRSLFGPGL